MANFLATELADQAKSLLSQLKAATPGSHNPGSVPNVSGGGGQDTINHQGYRKGLRDELFSILKELRAMGITLNAEGNPISSSGYTSTSAYPIG